MKQNLFRLIKCTGLVIFILLVRRIGPAAVWSAVTRVGLWPFLSAVSVLVLMSLLKAWRWKMICGGFGIPLPYPFCARSYLIGTFLGFLTPGRIGEMFRAYHVKARGYRMAHCLSTVILDRLFDLLLLGLLSGTALLYLNFRYAIFGVTAGPLIFRIAVMVAVVVLAAAMGLILIRRSAKIRKLVDGIRDFRPGPGRMGGAAALTFGASLLGYVQLFWIASSLDINLDFITLTSCALVMSLIQLLPVSILGIGTRDVTLVYLFGHFGIAPQKAIALSLINLSAHIFAIMPGMILFLIRKSENEASLRTVRMTGTKEA